ncbi:ABC transporter permease [Candidatus Bathyarchaeota archaeon]|nr:ABC transporter permease [Candidatus Bathyarchaeota archaeon]
MTRYIIRRLLYLIPLFLGILIIVFAATRVAGDPVRLMTAMNPHITEEARNNLTAYYGLDKPLWQQFLIYLANLLRGDLGNSYVIRGGIEVTALIGDYIWPTMLLQIVSIILALLIAIPVGIISAKRKYSKTDMTVTTTSLLGTCIPIFYMGIIVILIFAYYLGWFPAGGFVTVISESKDYFLGSRTLDIIWHMVLPVAVLTFALLAPIVLLIRSSMLEVLKQDYVLAARANGLNDRKVIYKHALRNALIPVVTYVGIYFGAMLAGAPITETVFNWPGVGRLFVQATNRLDFPVIMGITVIITLMTLIANLITDLTYGYIDPRIRVE